MTATEIEGREGLVIMKFWMNSGGSEQETEIM